MHTVQTIDSYLEARESGMNIKQAAEYAGVSITAGWHWDRGQFPHSYDGQFLSLDRILLHRRLIERVHEQLADVDENLQAMSHQLGGISV